MGFPSGTSGKEPARQCRRHKRCQFDPWVRKMPRRSIFNPFPYSCLENSMEGRAWQATIHGVAMSQTQLKQLSMHMDGDAMMLSDNYLRIKFQALLETMQMDLKGIMLSEIRKTNTV